MGLTSCRWITIAKMLARRRRECAFGIMPTAVSLSNAPPTATPSSVMGRFTPLPCSRRIDLHILPPGFDASLDAPIFQEYVLHFVH
jgi:hypothetical protein